MQSYRKDNYLGKLLLSFIITLWVFSVIFLVSNYFSVLNYQGIANQNSLLNKSLRDMDSLLNKSGISCDSSLLFDSSEKLDIVGSRIALLEERFGKNDLRVLEQKKVYTDLELKHSKIIENFNELCSFNYSIFSFFYSNDNDMSVESDRVGFILSTLKNSFPGKVMIYSYDFNLNYESIDNLKDKYNLTSAPMVVVNGNSIYPENIVQLEKYLN